MQEDRLSSQPSLGIFDPADAVSQELREAAAVIGAAGAIPVAINSAARDLIAAALVQSKGQASRNEIEIAVWRLVVHVLGAEKPEANALRMRVKVRLEPFLTGSPGGTGGAPAGSSGGGSTKSRGAQKRRGSSRS